MNAYHCKPCFLMRPVAPIFKSIFLKNDFSELEPLLGVASTGATGAFLRCHPQGTGAFLR